MRPAILEILNALGDYLISPLIVLWIAAHAALWDEQIFTKDSTHGLISGLFFLFLLIAIVYEHGYKKYYRFGRKKYFYVIHVAPLCVAIGGFLYGILIAYF